MSGGHTAGVEAALANLDVVDPDGAARLRAALGAPDPLDDGPGEDVLDLDAPVDEPADLADADKAARRQAKRAARRAAAEEGDTKAWDDFWAAVERDEADERGEAATEVIRGVEVAVPHDLPLKFDQRAEALQRSGREEDVRELVGYLFGDGALDAWVDAGMTMREFQTVLLWGMSHGKGRPITFAQAYEAVKSEGKSLLPSRSARRAFERTGGPSRPTSAASTGSPPRK